MEAAQLENLATLRAIVGYLGERGQYGWWQSSFFATGSQAFLAPIFARTQLLAQCTGVTRAAALVHDERIGIGSVYHLFRLPEDIEQGIHRLLHAPDVRIKLSRAAANKAAALDYLSRQAGTSAGTDVGPVRVGDTHDLRNMTYWRDVAALYAAGFSEGLERFPFFTDRA